MRTWVGRVEGVHSGYLLQGTGGSSGCLGLSWLAWYPGGPGLADLAPFQPQDPATGSPSFRAVRVEIHACGGSA